MAGDGNRRSGQDEEWVGDAEFLEFTQNDEERARDLRQTLEKLAREAPEGGALREMAREVLSGRVGLREAVAIPAYSEAVVEGMQPFKQGWDELSDTEREELAAQGQQDAEERGREIRREREEEQRRGRGGNPPRHSGGWTP